MTEVRDELDTNYRSTYYLTYTSQGHSYYVLTAIPFFAMLMNLGYAGTVSLCIPQGAPIHKRRPLVYSEPRQFYHLSCHAKRSGLCAN
jgi:hypothetical protein